MSIVWYNRLVGKGPDVLLSSAVDLHNDLFIGQQYVMEKIGEGKYRYACFSSHIEFWNYMEKQKFDRRTFNEVIPGDRFQKLRFDIDIDGAKDEEAAWIIINSLLKSTIKIFKSLGYELDLEEDIFIFESNRETKTSYHVIVSNFCFANCYVVKYIFDKILKKIPADEAQFIDPGIYSRNHMLRIMGNHKVDTRKAKTFVSEFTFNGEKVKNKADPDDLLEHSLVTWTFNCEKIFVDLPIDIVPEIEISNSAIKQALSFFRKHSLNEYYEPDLDRSENNVVYLKRIEKSYCQICKREHDSENAYLWINKNAVYFKCYRAREGNILLGKLEKCDDDSDEEEIYYERERKIIPQANDPIPQQIINYVNMAKTGEEKKEEVEPEKVEKLFPLYLYKLEDEKYYVERWLDLKKRLDEIKKKRGPHFIRHHPYLEVVEKMEKASEVDEQNLLFSLMKIHGIENVRGGKFDSIKFDPKQEAELIHLLEIFSNGK